MVLDRARGCAVGLVQGSVLGVFSIVLLQVGGRGVGKQLSRVADMGEGGGGQVGDRVRRQAWQGSMTTVTHTRVPI